MTKRNELSKNITPKQALDQVMEVSGLALNEIYREVLGRGGNSVRTVKEVSERLKGAIAHWVSELIPLKEKVASRSA